MDVHGGAGGGVDACAVAGGGGALDDTVPQREAGGVGHTAAAFAVGRNGHTVLRAGVVAVVIDAAVDADVAATGPQKHTGVTGGLGTHDGIGLGLGGGTGGHQLIQSCLQLVCGHHLHGDSAGCLCCIGENQICAEFGSVNTEAVTSGGGNRIGDVFAVQIQANRGLGGNDGLTGYGHIFCPEIVAFRSRQCGGGRPGAPHILGAVTAGLVGFFLAAHTGVLAQYQTVFGVDDLGTVQVGEEVVHIGDVGGI